ncbi:MAG: hypothetical protein JW768_09195 [Chitinispirillaceae bacterium]|nr:hypothetical protein [Chitinispirillaceae bacterium]
MRTFSRAHVVLIAVCTLLLLITCQNPSTPQDKVPDGATRNGYYIIMTPYAGGTINNDTTVAITWNSTVNATDPNVRISLYKGDSLASVIVSSTANDGTHSYSFAPIAPGIQYRIKINSTADTGKHDFGGYFTVKNKYFGTITLTSPVDTTTARVGSTVPVRWTTTDSIGSTITIRLYNDTAPTTYSYSATTSLNSYAFPLAEALIAGPNFRFKAWSNFNDSIYDYSDFFTIKSRYFGTITVTAPVDTTVALIGSSLTVQWTTTDSVGATVTIQLYYDTLAVGTARNVSATSGSYAYSLPSTLVPDSTYRIKVSSYYDAGIFGYSSTFRIQSQYDGEYTITAPDTGATWAAGSSYSITWTSTGSPGPNVRLVLFNDADSSALITSSASNSGTYQWSIPPGISTSDKYRVRISSFYDPTITAMSGYFTISGIQDDDYEVDNTRGQASTITLGTTQNHTLTYNDTDFVSMALDSGAVYFFTTSGTPRINHHLYPSDDSVTHAALYTSSGGSGFLRWTCAQSGTYFMRMTPYSSTYAGAYTFSAGRFDSLTTAKFITPDSSTTWASGSSYSVTWTPDTLLFGTRVYLYLWDEASRTLLTSTTNNNTGTQQLTIPAGLPSGKRYRIKMVNYSSSTIYGYSRLFTISGIAPDAFEPDNNRASASAVVLGTPQNHTLSLQDTDFVSMNLDSGKTYILTTTSATTYTYTYLFSSSDSVSAITTYSSRGSGSTRWTCTGTGTYYALIRQYSASYLGAYVFSVIEYDSTTAAKFITPDSTTTWASGSSYSVTWTPDTALFGATVYLYLWDDARGVALRSASVANGGAYTLSIPAGLVSGRHYRIKMVNYSSSTIFGYSTLFTISGLSADAFEPDNNRAQASRLTLGTVQNHTLTYLDTDFVAITLDSGSTYSFINRGTARTYNYLYSAADSVTQITYFANTSGSGSLRWTCTRTGAYYTRITLYSTSYTGDYDFSVTRYDSLTAARFIAPDSGAIWAAGSTYPITWTPDSILFGNTIALYLWDESQNMALAIATNWPNNGTYSYAVPAGLATGSSYRIRMVNYPSPSVAGYSKPFTITGIAPDAFEPDNDRARASTLTLGSPQSHTLTLGDMDFVTMTLDSGVPYLFTASGTAYTRTYLYRDPDSVTALANFTSTTSPGLFRWTCTQTGSYFCRIGQYSTSYLGAYTFNAMAFDSVAAGRFITPDSSTTWASGTAYSVTWTPDSAFFGTTVRLYLWDEKHRTLTSVVTSAPNSGSASFTVPTGLETGRNYRIRMANYSVTANYAYSRLFNISGIAPDAFEPDDSAGIATSIPTDSTVQARSLPRGDIDWLSFSSQTSLLYVVNVACSSTTTVRFFASDQNLTTPTQTATGTLTTDARVAWFCNAAATSYLSVQGTPGTYRAWVKAYDSSAYRLRVTSPGADTSIAVGYPIPIAWSATVSLGGTVDIFLYDRGNTPQTVAANITNSGSYTWTIPATVVPGPGYYIKVTLHNASEVFGNSGTFTISGF